MSEKRQLNGTDGCWRALPQLSWGKEEPPFSPWRAGQGLECRSNAADLLFQGG